MRSMPGFIAVLLAASVIGYAQKPLGSKSSYSRPTSPYAAHHKDNSEAFRRANARNGSAAALNKIEQQSLHSATPSGAAKPLHVKPADSPRFSAAKTGKNPPINFTGHAAGRGLTVTNPKSGGNSNSALGPRKY